MPMDSAPPPDLADPSSQALAAALPAIRAARTKGWGFVALAVILAVLAAFWAISALDEPFQWIIGIVIFGVFGVIGSVGWVQGKHERAVMPIIAQAFNLTYEKSPARFYESLPANFIPLGGRRSVDDMMSGRVGDRHFRFAECRTETGGKNSSTLFRGIVLDVQSASTLPSFMIASEKETRGFLFFKGRVQVDGMELVKQATGHDGQIYGLWTLSSETAKLAGLQAFMDRIIDLGPAVLGNSTLYSLVSTGGHYYVSLRHSRNLFKIGGLFSNDAGVMSDIRTAAEEFAYPIRLAGELLKAEQALLSAR